MSNLIERHKKNLASLINDGHRLVVAMQFNEFRSATQIKIVERHGEDAEEYIASLPKFKYEYQTWYTEARAVVKQIIPDRLSDFVQQYDRPNRRVLSVHNYTIDDYLNRLKCWEFVVVTLGIARMQQQLEILRSAQQRFESSLFDIRQSISTDFLSQEIVTAKKLVGEKLFSAAAVIAEIVLAKHMASICQSSGLRLRKNVGISVMNESLNRAGVIDLPQFRANEHLISLCNLCVRHKDGEPSEVQVAELVSGVSGVLDDLG